MRLVLVLNMLSSLNKDIIIIIIIIWHFYYMYLLKRHCKEKWRESGALYYMLVLFRKLFIWLKQLKHWRKSIASLAAYKPYTQSPENILSVLVTLGLLWLQLSDKYRKFKPK